MRILDVGDNHRGLAKQMWPEAKEVVCLDAPGTGSEIEVDLESPEFLDADLKGTYDIVFMSHVLEHLSYRVAPDVLKKLASCLHIGGVLFVKVPSLEYSTEQIILTGLNVPLLMQMFGSQENQWQYHKSSYTLPYLRGIIEEYCHLAIQVSRKAWTKILFADGVEVPFMENVVAGIKVEDERNRRESPAAVSSGEDH